MKLISTFSGISAFAVVIPIFLKSSIGLAEENSFADSVDKQCGLPPRIHYLRSYKKELLDDQILVSIKKCASGDADLQVYKWDLADAELQGCLINEYGHEKEYVKNLAEVYKNLESTKDVESQIEPYNQCVNNLRLCGEMACGNVLRSNEEAQIYSTKKLLKKTGVENEFSGCERSADRIMCATTVTNADSKKIKFWLSAKSSYFEDRNGERYLGTKARHAGGSWRGSAGHVYIEPSGKLKFWVEFNVPTDAAPLESLVLGVGKKFIGDIEFKYDLIVVR